MVQKELAADRKERFASQGAAGQVIEAGVEPLFLKLRISFINPPLGLLIVCTKRILKSSSSQ